MKKIATALLTLLTINSMAALSVTGTSGAAFAAEVSTGAETTEAMETAEITETVGWKVTKDSDGSVAAQGMSSFGKVVYFRSEMGGMIHNNSAGDS